MRINVFGFKDPEFQDDDTYRQVIFLLGGRRSSGGGRKDEGIDLRGKNYLSEPISFTNKSLISKGRGATCLRRRKLTANGLLKMV
jgi:hypothetical protein